MGDGRWVLVATDLAKKREILFYGRRRRQIRPLNLPDLIPPIILWRTLSPTNCKDKHGLQKMQLASGRSIYNTRSTTIGAKIVQSNYHMVDI
jgi:hypothetical protein